MSSWLSGALALAALLWPTLSLAKDREIRGVVTHTQTIRDLLATPSSLFVATSGGLQEFYRSSRMLRRTYTTQDGLASLDILRLSRQGSPTHQGSLVAHLKEHTCVLQGSRFACQEISRARRGSPVPALGRPTTRLSFDYFRGKRRTAHLSLPEGDIVGTAGGGAYFKGQRLGPPVSLPDSHVTSLAIFSNALWIGTFNGGLARQETGGTPAAVNSPSARVNALCSGRKRLFVGTSDGLYQTKNGVDFKKISFVQGAVVGLAYDGRSLWATTPGALYRVKDGSGPPTDVWWMPGGSRSLQKVSAAPGWLWMGSEDRGAIRMKLSPGLVSKDRPFEVFDRSKGLASSWSLSTLALPGGGALMSSLREGLTAIAPTGRVRRVSVPLSPWGLSGLAEEQGAWIGSQGGAAWLPRDGSPASPIVNLPDPRIHAFLRDTRPGLEHRLWIGSENGLAWLFDEPEQR